MTAMTYYKATRVDGTSFHNGTTPWEVGATVTIPEAARRTDLCGPGILHVSDAPGETLIGGQWPCRLFRVTPGEIVASDGHKHGTWSVTVLEELPAWQALGPMGEHVTAVIQRCRTDFLRIQRTAAWSAAWSTAGSAAGSAARSAARSTAGSAARSAAWSTAGSAAGPAASTAILAILTWDLATASGPYTIEMRDLLVAPWKEVVGLPEGLA